MSKLATGFFLIVPSVFLYVSIIQFRPEKKSKAIPIGMMNMINSTTYPKGFNNKASPNSPCKIDNTDRVEPQDGQGIPVAHFTGQTVVESNLFFEKNR